MILIALIVGFILGRITIGNYQEPKKEKEKKYDWADDCPLRDGHGN